MKNIFAIGVTIWLVVATFTFVGCTTTAQRNAYTTIASIEAAASTAYDGYTRAVIQHQATTNGVPAVSKAFNDLQASLTLAAAVDRAGTNAIAGPDLEAELGDLFSLIQTVTKK